MTKFMLYRGKGLKLGSYQTGITLKIFSPIATFLQLSKVRKYKNFAS